MWRFNKKSFSHITHNLPYPEYDLSLDSYKASILHSRWELINYKSSMLGFANLKVILILQFGHCDSPLSWARHLEALRDVQRRTMGITEFVSLSFILLGALSLSDPCSWICWCHKLKSTCWSLNSAVVQVSIQDEALIIFDWPCCCVLL